MRKNNSSLGKIGEEIALEYLQNKGYQILKRNYRYGHGEIDIIAKHPNKDILVFIEVKTRNSLQLGNPAYAINKTKIKQLKKIAELYLYDNKITETECNFDVITILLTSRNKPIIEHYENAFI